jgi:hypothetical protein
MSATHGMSALAIAILIAWPGPGATQETGTAGAYAHQELELRGKPSSSRAVPIGIGEILHLSPGLSENSWDFGNPDSVPGFGTMPQGYDSRALRPRFSGE